MQTNRLKNPRRRGFTLIELLVAMAITALLVTILVSVTSVATDAWRKGRSEIRASRQAKALLDVMAKDFQSSVVRKGNTFQWMYAQTVASLPGPNSAPSTNAADIAFFTGATDRYDGKIGTADDKGGDVCAVGYRFAYEDPIAGTPNNYSTFSVYRTLINPDRAFNEFLGQTDIKAKMDNAVTGMTDAERRATFVCENVYQYTVTFILEVSQTTGSGASARTTRFPVRVSMGQNGAANRLLIFGDRIDTDANASTLRPTVTAPELAAARLTGVEISLTVLSDSGAEALKRRSFGTPDDLAKFLAEHSFEHSRVIEVPQS